MTYRPLDCRIYHIALFFCLLQLLVACKNKNIPQEDTRYVGSFALSGDTIGRYPYFLKGVFFLKDDILIMIDPMNAGEMYMLDTQTGQMSYHSITDSLRDLNPSLFPFSFYQFDMTSYYYYSFVDNHLKFKREGLQFKGITTNRAVRLNENQYATLGFFRTGLLGLYDKKSKEINYYGHYPCAVNVPIMERQAVEQIVQSFQGNITYSEKHSKIIYCSSRFAYIACYTFTDSKLSFDWEHHIVPPPEVAVVDGFLKRDSTSSYGGFSSITTVGDYIFAPYWQVSAADWNFRTDFPRLSTDSILVYNMNGVHVATFHTDHPLSDLTVDMERKTIYGLSYVDEPVIVRFRFDDDMLPQ